MLTKTKKEDYYICNECKITSLTKGRMCPCPRGGCEAEICGIVKITTEVILKVPKEKQKKKLNSDELLILDTVFDEL